MRPSAKSVFLLSMLLAALPATFATELKLQSSPPRAITDDPDPVPLVQYLSDITIRRPGFESLLEFTSVTITAPAAPFEQMLDERFHAIGGWSNFAVDVWKFRAITDDPDPVGGPCGVVVSCQQASEDVCQALGTSRDLDVTVTLEAHPNGTGSCSGACEDGTQVLHECLDLQVP